MTSRKRSRSRASPAPVRPLAHAARPRRATVSFPRANPSGFGWVEEGQPLPRVALGDDADVIAVAKLAGLITFSNESLDDPDEPVGDLLSAAVADAMGPELDAGLLFGAGGVDPDGCFSLAPEAIGGADFRADVIGAWAELVDAGADPSSIVAFASASVIGYELARTTTDGVPIHADGAEAMVGPGVRMIAVPSLSAGQTLVAACRGCSWSCVTTSRRSSPTRPPSRTIRRCAGSRAVSRSLARSRRRRSRKITARPDRPPRPSSPGSGRASPPAGRVVSLHHRGRHPVNRTDRQLGAARGSSVSMTTCTRGFSCRRTGRSKESVRHTQRPALRPRESDRALTSSTFSKIDFDRVFALDLASDGHRVVVRSDRASNPPPSPFALEGGRVDRPAGILLRDCRLRLEQPN
ncbi:MAG: phage major capsid protein [Acidimicrobiaceae bacterium]|nr:phage major capsid protein [Acidimicrobiaceae bacterium]